MISAHRAWAEISLDNLSYNFRQVRAATKAKVMSVVKADAYGHGMEQVARRLHAEGTDWFAVSNIAEALELRRYVDEPILILGYTPPECAGELGAAGISQAVYSPEYADSLSASATAAGVSVKVHIKVDTGMHRIGFNSTTAADEVARVCGLGGLIPEGIFTHFASADRDGDRDGRYTRGQYEQFTAVIDRLNDAGIKFEYRHCCNSAAIFTYPDMHLDMVRAGIVLYGLEPSSEVELPALKPVMELKSEISMVKTLPAGCDISYGRTYTTEREMRVATVAIGYADGYQRSYSREGYMLVGGKRAKIVGRVCMDQLVIDVTDIAGVSQGDTVTLFGADGGERLSVNKLAEWGGTINYECVCLIGKRVPRVYL